MVIWLETLVLNPQFVLGATVAQTSKVKIGVLMPNSESVFPVHVARAKGFFSDEGLDADVTFTTSPVEALLADQLAIITNSVEGGLIAQQQGIRVIAVAGLQLNPTQFLVTLPEIKSFEQLRGKILAVSEPAGTDAFVMTELLKKQGIMPHEVSLRRSGFTPARMAALEARQVSATMLASVGWFSIQEKAIFSALAGPKEIGRFPWTFVQAKADWARKNKNIVTGYIRGLQKAIGWLRSQANFDEATSIIAKQSKLPPQVVEKFLDLVQNESIYATERPTVDDFKPVVDILVAKDVLKRPVDVQNFLDPTFWDEAVGKSR
jgi:ABC-type nitrate/sulfonate/bicarbonate transport system substrate-binding protein